jgi:hypothetical protein
MKDHDAQPLSLYGRLQEAGRCKNANLVTDPKMLVCHANAAPQMRQGGGNYSHSPPNYQGDNFGFRLACQREAAHQDVCIGNVEGRLASGGIKQSVDAERTRY